MAIINIKLEAGFSNFGEFLSRFFRNENSASVAKSTYDVRFTFFVSALSESFLTGANNGESFGP